MRCLTLSRLCYRINYTLPLVVHIFVSLGVIYNFVLMVPSTTTNSTYMVDQWEVASQQGTQLLVNVCSPQLAWA